MTTVITRLFAEEDAAKKLAQKLYWEGVPSRAIQMISAMDGESEGDLIARMTQARVHETAAPAYAGAMKGGETLFVARVTYKPLGVARLVRETLEGMETIDVGPVEDDYYMPDGVEKAPSVLKDHPRFLTMPLYDDEIPRGPITADYWPLLRARKPSKSLMKDGRRMSRAFWPMPLVTRKRKANSAISGGRFMSRAFWPQPLLSNKPRRLSVIRGGGRPLSRMMGWPTVSTRP